MVFEIDEQVSRDKRPAKTIKSSHRGIIMRDSKIEEPNVQAQSTTYQRSEKASHETQREKKKDYCRNHGRDRNQNQRGQESSTPDSEVNTLELGKPAKNKRNRKRLDQDMSIVTYYNCNKKDYYSSLYPEP